MQGLSPQELGTLLHRCFEILLQRPEFEDELQAVLGDVATSDECTTIAATVNAFRRYVQEELAPVSLKCEEPFIRLDEKGIVITGTIDLLVETVDDFWLIDHKSDQIDETDLSAMTAWYYPQLRAYCEAVSDFYPNKVVKRIMINWIGLGILTVISQAVCFDSRES